LRHYAGGSWFTPRRRSPRPHRSRTLDVACIVGVVAGSLTARAVAETLGPIVPERLLLLRTPSVQADDDVFMLTTAIPWLPVRASAEELVARVQQLVTTRHTSDA